MSPPRLVRPDPGLGAAHLVSPPASDKTPGGSFPLTEKAALLDGPPQTRGAPRLVRCCACTAARQKPTAVHTRNTHSAIWPFGYHTPLRWSIAPNCSGFTDGDWIREFVVSGVQFVIRYSGPHTQLTALTSGGAEEPNSLRGLSLVCHCGEDEKTRRNCVLLEVRGWLVHGHMFGS